MESMEKSRPAGDGGRRISVSEAIAEIGLVGQRIMATGAVDTEPEDLQRLMADVRSGKTEPAEAVMQARALEEGRQSYH